MIIIDYEALGKHLESNKDSGLAFWNIINNYIKIYHKENVSIFNDDFNSIVRIAQDLFPDIRSIIDCNKL